MLTVPLPSPVPAKPIPAKRQLMSAAPVHTRCSGGRLSAPAALVAPATMATPGVAPETLVAPAALAAPAAMATPAVAAAPAAVAAVVQRSDSAGRNVGVLHSSALKAF